ncbi:GNAT family N-acetyltransferase [Paraclostridium sordellii]|uniref:GNAT family N-acetyltransferase n=1 Tax=Paraclostridium sordellii TaxID=1505 RepID=UPI003A8C6502
MGYTISEKYQRKVYAYEILNEFIEYSFKKFKNYNEIVAMVHPDNIASKRLLEKLNFKNEGYSEKMKSVIYLLQI